VLGNVGTCVGSGAAGGGAASGVTEVGKAAASDFGGVGTDFGDVADLILEAIEIRLTLVAALSIDRANERGALAVEVALRFLIELADGARAAVCQSRLNAPLARRAVCALCTLRVALAGRADERSSAVTVDRAGASGLYGDSCVAQDREATAVDFAAVGADFGNVAELPAKRTVDVAQALVATFAIDCADEGVRALRVEIAVLFLVELAEVGLRDAAVVGVDLDAPRVHRAVSRLLALRVALAERADEILTAVAIHVATGGKLRGRSGIGAGAAGGSNDSSNKTQCGEKAYAQALSEHSFPL
jgi:hypothetical protein